jgi:hypothetical protein
MVEPRRVLPQTTDRLPLGDSGLQVSPFCLGIVSDPAVVHAAYEAGINFFFLTADMHWPLYEATRIGLYQLWKDKPSARDEMVIGVVSYVTQPEFGWMPFNEVVDFLPGLGRVDLSIAGGSYGHEIKRRLETYAQHRARKHVGIRATGVTFHDRAAILPVLDEKKIDIGYVRYNPLHPGAETEVFPHIRDDHPLLFNFKSTMGALDADQLAKLGVGSDYWTPHITDYYRFALTQPALDGILCSFPHLDAVRELTDALAKGPLDGDDRQYLLDLGELFTGKASVQAQPSG